MTRRFLRAAGLAATLCASFIAAPLAQAQSYPVKPVIMVSPYLPGGGADSIGRLIAEAAARELGQPIIVESKPGAEGAIGSLDVAKSPADGYRILYGGAGSMMLSTAVRKNPAFDPVAAFTPIAATVDFAMFLYVHPSFPANNLKEFLAYVKANPGKVSYAASGGLSLLNMAALESKYGLEMVRIPYKGEPAAATDLVTDRVQALFATTSISAFVRDGKLKLLATTLPKRSELFPNVPTFAESGLPDPEFGGGWMGFYAPVGTPKPIVDRLNRAFTAGMSDPKVQESMRRNALVYTPVSPETLAAYTLQQRDLYRRSIRDLKIPQVD